MLGYGFGTNSAYAVDVGANPTPKVDIAVSVPSDYPGTFLDFKEELTQKLIDEGMEPGSFRITDTAVSIDTSDLNGWYVYSHYRDQAAYNALNLSEDQQDKQPYRQASASSMSSGSYDIKDYVNKTTNKFTNTSCLTFNNHVYVYQSGENNVTNMAFAGYGNPAYSDWMIYPASSSSTRKFSFNIDANVIDTHTLEGFGFWMNSALINGKVYGYLLYFDAASAAGGTGKMIVKKVNGVPADSLTFAFTGGAHGSAFSPNAISGSEKSVSLGSKKKLRLTVELKQDSMTVQTESYDASGNLTDLQTPIRNLSIPQFYAGETLNGFGPWVGYTSHGCSAFSAIVYTDLEMSYEASAFDALKTTQYYQGAEQKYFINLVGSSGNPNIPEEKTKDGATNEHYTDGINRMNENEIFYISNAQDGQIITDSNDTHQGLGSTNGLIAMNDDYVGQMAQYIYKNYIEGAKFNQAPIKSDLPLANFYLINNETGDQLMTVHQKHLADGQSVPVYFKDQSKPGTLAGEGGKIAQWRGKIYDPDNKQVYDSGWTTDTSTIDPWPFTNQSTSGKWTFELTVKDQNGNESKAAQTYITVFLDEDEPFIEGANTAKNVATITLTDTGMGIDEDGITFIEDGRGSGVAAYWVTNDPNATPADDDWEILDTPVHEYSFNYDLVDTNPVVVWVRDECGNVGNKAVFQPTRVVVQDPDGNPIDDYIVIDDNPIIVLPDEDELDDPEDPDDKFAGWTTEGGDPVTPGTTVPKGDDHTIIIRPSYAKDYANLVYLANGGLIEKSDGSTGVSAQYQVISGNSIQTKIEDQNVQASREGYTFTGWKLVNIDTDDAAKSVVDTSAGTTTANQLIDPDDQVANLVLKDPEGDPKDDTNVTRRNYYLVAQWEIGNYKVRFDANGGSLGNVREIVNVDYGTNVGGLSLPTSGRGIPTKPGYIFQGWSTTKNAMDNYSNTIKVADGVTGIPTVTAPTMPAKDLTLYAVWKYDTNKFIVSFDSMGGSTVKDVAYPTSTTTAYPTDSMAQFPTPSRSGYDFAGWYLVTATDPETGEYTLAETPTDGTGSIDAALKKNHTFAAKWTPRDDTKYTIQYMYNTGNKDANGNYIYRPATAFNQTGVGTTESAMKVNSAETLSEITVDGTTYWFNSENPNNITEGTITGDANKDVLRLYCDRYFSVDATKGGNGSGSVTPATGVKEGTNPTVSWKADEGSKVSKVVVDGVVRDDLLTQTSYTFENGVHENHTIYVEFAITTTPGGNTPGGDQPDPVVPATYQVKTSLVGNIDGSATITETTNLKAGANHSVTWKKGNYEINKIEVDGTEWNGWKSESDPKTSIDFTGISANHEVVITLSKLPSIGGGTTEGQYTITVNTYGAFDDLCEIPKTTTVNAGESKTLKWNAKKASDYEIYKVFVDGKEFDVKQWTFSKIDANHVIDIYFKEKDTDSEPNYSPDSPDNVKVTTQINGGPGTISGGAVLEKGSGYTVEWTAKDNRDANAATVDGDLAGDQKDTAYTHYELVNVIVDGKVVEPDEDNKVILSGITDDTDVQVNIRPVNYDVKTAIYGGGEVSKSRVLWKDQNYFNIMAKIPDANKLVLVTVDEEPVWRAEADPVTPAAEVQATNGTATASDQTTSGDVNQTAADATEPETPSATETDETPATDEATQGEQGALTELETEDSDTTAVEITAEELSQMSDEEVAALQELMGDDFLTRVAEADGVPEIQFDAANKRVNVNNISQDHVVRFYSIPNDEPYDGSDEKVKEVQDQYRDVVVKIVDQNGNPIAGQPGMMQNVKKGDPAKAEWSVPTGYELQGVTVNNIPTEAPDGSIDFTSLNDNTTIVVKLKKTLPNEDKAIPNDSDPTYAVETSLQGGAGTISGNGTYSENVDATVTWSVPEADNEEVKYVFVTKTIDGKEVTENHPELVTATNTATPNDQGNKTASYTIDDPESGQTYKVAVVIGPKDKTPTNVDSDGDGKPDVNVDTDGDGKPDVNKDTDGDGKPDVNIVDEDGDGTPDPVDPTDPKKPNVNVDTDGDGKPDVNVDTDGDGKPDINIVDEDGDGKPDPVDPTDPKKPNVNVDVTGDGKPDVNVDTDGDGKPDVNIVDKDGDGKPDPVDPTKPVIPDVNVVIDPETGEPIYNFDVPVTDPEDPKYWPTVNVDTDGDGKPDVNIDVDGDGTPDINIVDEDKNGKPDPIKPGTKPTPTINVDTDGDGIPDEGIDRNYGSPEFWQYVDEQMANQNGDNAIDNSKDKNDKSKKSKSSKTGDMTAPIAGGIALIALLSGLVLVLARRRKEN